jgi:predicted NAD/FAD-binding protein
MSRIAIIGSGIAGLACAHRLSPAHEVTVFERDVRIGGHTHTVTTPDGVRVDTGFIVHNRENYPNLVRLLEELGVETGPSDMSFACQGRDFTWCSRGPNGLFTQRRNALRPSFWKFLGEVARFNAWGRRAAEGLPGSPILAEALDREGFSETFRQNYLYPMAGAVWSTPMEAMGEFPARTLLAFFRNHGMLGLTTQHPWRTIPGGTGRYLDPITRAFRDRIHIGATLRSVTRDAAGVQLKLDGDQAQHFDEVIFACHGNQVLPLLADATPQEREILGAFRYRPNPTWLHHDAAVLPRHRRAWASWNTRPGAGGLLLTYHMNRLQPLGTSRDWFVSLHPEGQVDPANVAARLDYEHPAYDDATVAAQARWEEISGRQHTHFCGAYWGYGFHEDGLVSGYRVAQRLLS